MFETLSKGNFTIQTIELNDNSQFDDKCIKSLGEYIKSNNFIAKVDMSCTNISDAGIEVLAPYIYGNTILSMIFLSGNKGITDKSVPYLTKIIETSCIVDIWVNDTSITQRNVLKTSFVCKLISYGSSKLMIYYE